MRQGLRRSGKFSNAVEQRLQITEEIADQTVGQFPPQLEGIAQ